MQRKTMNSRKMSNRYRSNSADAQTSCGDGSYLASSCKGNANILRDLFGKKEMSSEQNNPMVFV